MFFTSFICFLIVFLLFILILRLFLSNLSSSSFCFFSFIFSAFSLSFFLSFLLCFHVPCSSFLFFLLNLCQCFCYGGISPFFLSLSCFPVLTFLFLIQLCPWLCLFIFSFLSLFLSTFLSHSVPSIFLFLYSLLPI